MGVQKEMSIQMNKTARMNKKQYNKILVTFPIASLR